MDKPYVLKRALTTVVLGIILVQQDIGCIHQRTRMFAFALIAMPPSVIRQGVVRDDCESQSYTAGFTKLRRWPMEHIDQGGLQHRFFLDFKHSRWCRVGQAISAFLSSLLWTNRQRRVLVFLMRDALIRQRTSSLGSLTIVRASLQQPGIHTNIPTTQALSFSWCLQVALTYPSAPLVYIYRYNAQCRSWSPPHSFPSFFNMSSNHIVVIIGASGTGLAAARRLAGNRTIFLGARSQSTLASAKETLTDEGFNVLTHEVHITSLESVRTFAAAAGSHGIIDVVVHTSGVSPSTATSVEEIIQVDLLGTAYVIDAFLEYAYYRTSVICVSSSAAHMSFAWPPLSPALQRHLALAPVSKFLSHDDYQNFKYAGPQSKVLWAYWFAKYSNLLRVQGAAIAYGKKGARINSISPGLTMTKMGRAECEGENGEGMRAMMESSAIRRAATPYDVANAIAFLAGSESSYITGSDLKIDGGVVSSMRWEVLEDGLPADEVGVLRQ